VAVWECGGSIYCAVEEAVGRGAAGNGGMAGGRPAAGAGKGKGGRPEDEDALTCGPHTAAGQREREGRRR
jgi:hypothetical protein